MKTIDEEYAKRIRVIADNRDPEASHVKADDLLCELLERDGYSKTVDEFKRLKKRYS